MRVEVWKLPAYADRFGNRAGRVASSYLLVHVSQNCSLKPEIAQPQSSWPSLTEALMKKKTKGWEGSCFPTMTKPQNGL
jgi:hypothetical protein